MEPRFKSPAFCLRAEGQKDHGHADLIHEPRGAASAWGTLLSGMREVPLQFINTRGSSEVPNKQSLQLLSQFLYIRRLKHVKSNINTAKL